MINLVWKIPAALFLMTVGTLGIIVVLISALVVFGGTLFVLISFMIGG